MPVGAASTGGPTMPDRPVRRVGSHCMIGWLLSWCLLVTKVEFPVPALIVVDLHVVVCRVLCLVTCAPCWAALCTGESNP